MFTKLKLYLIFIGFIFSSVYAETWISIPKGEYEIVTKTLLPHLEENLRNTNRIDIHCLNRLDVNALFPILNHPSFHGCNLFVLRNNKYTYDLQCENQSAASGYARILIKENQFTADLNIKMGAKNMTMTQAVEATKINNCE